MSRLVFLWTVYRNWLEMRQKKNTGLMFTGPKQTVSSLGHARLNARNHKNSCKDNISTRDNHLSERKGGGGVSYSSSPHETMLGINPMGVVKAAHSYASTIVEGGKISGIASIAPFPFEHFFMKLSKAHEEESSIRAKLELPMVVSVRKDKQQSSQQPRSFSLSESESIGADLDDLLPLPSFRERNVHVSCAKSKHRGSLPPQDSQYWQGHELPAEQRSIRTTPVMDRRMGVVNHFPPKRQRVGNSRHLARSTAEKIQMKRNNKAVKNATQTELLERKKLSSMKLHSQLDRRKQQSYFQRNDYHHITPDTNVVSSVDSGSIISIRSEDDQWFKVLPVRSGQSDVKKSVSSTGFHHVNGGIFNVGNGGVSRETVCEVIKNQLATTKVMPKKESLETPPSVMISTSFLKESKIKDERAGAGINNVRSSSSSHHDAADEVTRVRDQTPMKAISKDRTCEVPSAASTGVSNEQKVNNEKISGIINGEVHNTAHHRDIVGEGMKIDDERAAVVTRPEEEDSSEIPSIALIATPKPKNTESAVPTAANAPLVPSVINHIHVEAPTSTQTTFPPEVLNLLREMTEHQYTLAEAAKRQMEVLEQPANKKSDMELLDGIEPPPSAPPPSIPMHATSAPIVVVQPSSSYHPVTAHHKENSSNSNNRNLSRLNTALVSAVLAVSNRIDNMDSKVMERVIEVERMAQEALKESKDSKKKLTEATLESRFEKVCLCRITHVCVCVCYCHMIL